MELPGQLQVDGFLGEEVQETTITGVAEHLAEQAAGAGEECLLTVQVPRAVLTTALLILAAAADKQEYQLVLLEVQV